MHRTGKAGWTIRYLPATGRAVASDVAAIASFRLGRPMFVSATVNAFVAIAWSMPTWAAVMPVFGIVSRVAVFVSGFVAILLSTVRRIRAMPAIPISRVDDTDRVVPNGDARAY
jgi:intracellular septation protein